MKNKHNLPQWLYETILWSRANYSAGLSNYTTTSLLKPTRIYALEKIHKEEIEEDVSDSFASFFGDSIHTAMESALKDNPRYIVEQRFYRQIEVDGKVFTIGGQIDLYDSELKTLSDHKFTSIMKLLMGEKKEYETQLAINRWLLRGASYEVDSVKINLFIKDWRKGESKKNPNYPDIPFVELEFPLWPDSNVEDFLVNSVREKEFALQGHHAPCTPEERWSRPTKWALMKNGQKRAVKLFDSEQAAVSAVGNGMYVEVRPGEDIRCDSYCQVNQFCDYYINKSNVF